MFNFADQNVTKLTQLCTACRDLHHLLFALGIAASDLFLDKTVVMQIWKQIPSKIESLVG